jgi:2OG-Fe(II) oxygenase superfamily
VRWIDISKLEGKAGNELAARFRLADPFPHVVVTDLVKDEALEADRAFPDCSWEGWADRSSEFQPGKWSCRDIDIMPPIMQEIIGELSGPRALRAFSTITGISSLLPDPFLEGGGLNYVEPGGKLVPHTDFHDHPYLHLYRRVNALLYLNRGWKPADGGEVALFNLGSNEPAVVVPPMFGTCVIFATDHRSVHSVMPVSAPDGQRKSVALYYYTVERAEFFGGDRRTYWYDPEKSRVTGPTAKLRLGAMKTALRASKLLFRAANRVDPKRPDVV